MVRIDIIILSYAKDDQLKFLTEQTISSLLSSEDSTKVGFEIIVLESQKSLKPFQYPNTVTIYPEVDFGFNRYLNIGITASSSKFVCLCNNDLIFHKGWATAILDQMKKYPDLESATPLCPNFEPTRKYQGSAELIFANKKTMFEGVFTGWCIFLKREIFGKIGLLDEQFEFWYADSDFAMTLLKHNIKHALVLNSNVTHLGNQSHETLEERLDEFTHAQRIKYQKKWGEGRFVLHKVFRKMLGIFYK